MIRTKAVTVRKTMKKQNFLDFIPVISPRNDWHEKEDIVVIDMNHNGVFDKVAQKLFSKPRVSHIDLDAYGSFVWKAIDGKRDIEQIAKMLKEEFGDDVEPLYDRLVQYFKILYNNGFIKYDKSKAKQTSK